MTEYFLQKKCPNCSRKPGLGMGKNPCKDCGGTPPTFRLTDDKTWEEVPHEAEAPNRNNN